MNNDDVVSKLSYFKASEASFAGENARVKGRHDLARLALLAQIGEHARKLGVALLHN